MHPPVIQKQPGFRVVGNLGKVEIVDKRSPVVLVEWPDGDRNGYHIERVQDNCSGLFAVRIGDSQRGRRYTFV